MALNIVGVTRSKSIVSWRSVQCSAIVQYERLKASIIEHKLRLFSLLLLVSIAAFFKLIDFEKRQKVEYIAAKHGC